MVEVLASLVPRKRAPVDGMALPAERIQMADIKKMPRRYALGA